MEREKVVEWVEGTRTTEGGQGPRETEIRACEDYQHGERVEK